MTRVVRLNDTSLGGAQWRSQVWLEIVALSFKSVGWRVGRIDLRDELGESLGKMVEEVGNCLPKT
jgi:hypothetical protein